MEKTRFGTLLSLALLVAACSHHEPPIAAAPIAPVHTASSATTASTKSQLGTASYYGKGFAGRPTANGEIFDPTQMTCAHRTLPFGTWLKVTNLGNGKSVVVRVNDRGPFTKRRVLDLSEGAAKKLDMMGIGTAHVRLDVVTATAQR